MDFIRTHAMLNDIFPEEECTFDRFCTLMKQMSLTDTIIWCCRLNLLLSNPRPESDQQIQQLLISHFLLPQEIDKLNELARKKGGADKIFCFFRGQLLQLLRWATLLCVDHADDGTSFDKPQTREAFVKCALIASEIWDMETYGEQLGKESPEDRGELIRECLQSFRNGSLGSGTSPHPMSYIPRGKEVVHDLLPTKMPDFEKEFIAASQMNLEQYYACSMTVASLCNNVKLADAFKSATSGLFNLLEIDAGVATSKKDGFNILFQRYFNLEAQTASDLKKAFWEGKTKNDDDLDQVQMNLRCLRERPIFLTADRRAIIIDPLFFSEKFAAGPVFALPSKQRGKALYQYGFAFDAYAKNALSRSLENAKYEGAQNLSFDNDPGVIGGIKIDAVLRCPAKKETDLIIFEAKANFLSDNPEDYIEELEKKFVEGADRRVGVGQLADWLKALSALDKVPSSLSEKPIGRVFPVLLVRDFSLTTPPHPEYLADRFRQEIDPKYSLSSGLMHKNNLLIAPLIIMPIGLVELLEQGLRSFSLLQLLAEYSTECRDRMTSINNFLYGKKKYENLEADTALRARFQKTMDDALVFIKSTI